MSTGSSTWIPSGSSCCVLAFFLSPFQLVVAAMLVPTRGDPRSGGGFAAGCWPAFEVLRLSVL